MTTPIVTVRGESRIEVAPDLAEFSITALANGHTAEQVTGSLSESAAELRVRLEQFAAAIETSSTSGFSVSPDFDHRNGRKIRGYRGSFTTSVALHDFDQLSPLIAALAGVALTEVNGPWWSLRPDHAAYRLVRIAAIEEATSRARDYAAAFGAELQELLEVSDLEGGFGYAREMRASAFAAKGGGVGDEQSFDFEPALQTVTGQVTVRFTMTDATLPPVGQ